MLFKGATKSSLQFIAFSDADQVISMLEVGGSVDLSFTSSGEKVGDEWKWITTILLGNFVEATIVYTESERAVLLVNKKDRGTVGGTSRAYGSSAKIVVNELSEGFKF